MKGNKREYVMSSDRFSNEYKESGVKDRDLYLDDMEDIIDTDTPLPDIMEDKWIDMWKELHQCHSMEFNTERAVKMLEKRMSLWEDIYNEVIRLMGGDEVEMVMVYDEGQISVDILWEGRHK